VRLVVFIPCRLASTRLPGKPLALIAGKPMVQRVYEQALKARGVAEVVVATDSAEIAAAVEGFGGRAVMTAAEHACGTDRVAEAARSLGLDREDIAVNIQGDQPLCPPELVEQVIEPLRADPGLGMSTLAAPMRAREAAHPDNVCLVIDRQGRAIYFSRAMIPHPRDPGPPRTYLKHLGVYAYRAWFLEVFSRLPLGELEQIEKLEQLRALENGHPIGVIVTEHDSIEVDRPEDIRRVEAILAARGEA